jgi:hypothetical protein
VLYGRADESNQYGNNRDDDEEINPDETADGVLGVIRDIFHVFSIATARSIAIPTPTLQ